MTIDDISELKAILIHEIYSRIELLEISDNYSADEKMNIFNHVLEIIDSDKKEIKEDNHD